MSKKHFYPKENPERSTGYNKSSSKDGYSQGKGVPESKKQTTHHEHKGQPQRRDDSRHSKKYTPTYTPTSNVIVDNVMKATYTFYPKNEIPKTVTRKETHMTSKYEIHDALRHFFNKFKNLNDVYDLIIRKINEGTLNLPPTSERKEEKPTAIVKYTAYYEDTKPEELCKYVPSHVIKEIEGGGKNIKIRYDIPQFLKDYFYNKVKKNITDIKEKVDMVMENITEYISDERKEEIVRIEEKGKNTLLSQKEFIKKNIIKKIEDRLLENPLPEYIFEYEDKENIYSQTIPKKIIQRVDGKNIEFVIEPESTVSKYFFEKVSRNYRKLGKIIYEYNSMITDMREIDNIIEKKEKELTRMGIKYNQIRKKIDRLRQELLKKYTSIERKKQVEKEIEIMKVTEKDRIKKMVQQEIQYHIESKQFYNLHPSWYNVLTFQEDEDSVEKYRKINKFGKPTYTYNYIQNKVHKSPETVYYKQAPPEDFYDEEFSEKFSIEIEEENLPEESSRLHSVPKLEYDIRNVPYPGDIPILSTDFDKKIGYHIDGLIYAWVETESYEGKWNNHKRLYIYSKKFPSFDNGYCNTVSNYFNFIYSETDILFKIADMYPSYEIRINGDTLHIPRVNFSSDMLYNYILLDTESQKNIDDVEEKYHKNKYFYDLDVYNREFSTFTNSYFSPEEHNQFQELITLWFIDNSISVNQSVRILFQPNELFSENPVEYISDIFGVYFSFENSKFKIYFDKKYKEYLEKYIQNDSIDLIIIPVIISYEENARYILCIFRKYKFPKEDGSLGDFYIYDPYGSMDSVYKDFQSKYYRIVINNILPTEFKFNFVPQDKWIPLFSFLSFEEQENMIMYEKSQNFSRERLASDSLKWCLWFMDLMLLNYDANIDFNKICVSGLNHVSKYRKYNIYFEDYINLYIIIKLNLSIKYKYILENPNHDEVYNFIQNYFNE